MNKSRISMIVAAAGLVLVGLLAAVLFTPGDTAPEQEQAATEEVTPLEPRGVEMSNVLGYPLDVPPIEAPKPLDEPKPAVDPTPVVPKSSGGVIDYKIEKGDMISKLAEKYGCTSEAIYKLNDGLNKESAAKIRVGQTIKIPVGEKGAAAVAEAGIPKGSADYQPGRTVIAEAGDTAFSLAIEYYGARNLFRKIIDANPSVDWTERRIGGEEIVLPQIGTAPGTAEKEIVGKETVERSSLIPPRK